MLFSINMVAGLAFLVLYYSSLPLYFFFVIFTFFRVRHNFKCLIASILLMSLVVALAFFPSVYMELTDLTLWVFTIFFLYVFSQMQTNLESLKNSLYIISAIQLFSGIADFLLKLTIKKQLLYFLSKSPYFECDCDGIISGVTFFGMVFHRVQGLLPEPSYFGIISVFLYISLKSLKPQDKIFTTMLLITVFLSYSIIAITLLILYFILSFTYYSRRKKIGTILLILIFVPIIILDGALTNQFYMKLSGEHVSGISRYFKFITAIDLIIERPFFGYQPGYFVSINGTQTGNVYLTLILENGLFGLLFFAIFIWLTYRPVFKIRNINILLPQFSCFFFIGAFSNPIFFLPLIYCLHKERLDNSLRI